MKTLFTRLMITILAASWYSAAFAQAAPDPLHEKAMVLFKYEMGVWRSRWERLDAQGEIAGTFEGTETFTWTLDGTAQELVTRIDGQPQWSRAVRFYSPVEKHVVFISVNTAGDYWHMYQDLETEVVQSHPHRNADGSETIVRFTITRKTPDEQDIVMDVSRDGGETWARRTNQYMRRVSQSSE